MNWIKAIENRLKAKHKQPSFSFRIFQVLVYLVVILFVLHLFVKHKVIFTDKVPTADVYDC